MRRTLAIAQVVWLDWARRKDVYVFLALLAGLLLLLTSVDLFGMHGALRFALDVGLLLAWLFGWLLALNAGSRELPAEESRGTVYLLLSKPITRAELVIGKWLGAWVSTIYAVALFYAATLAVAGLHGVLAAPRVLLQAFVLHAAGLAVLTALTTWCATRFNRDAAASLAGVASAAAWVLVPQVPVLIGQASGWRASALLALFYALPHLELFDLRRRVVHDFPPVAGGTCLMVLAYGAALTAMMLLLAWIAYRRKRFVRDRLAE